MSGACGHPWFHKGFFYGMRVERSPRWQTKAPCPGAEPWPVVCPWTELVSVFSWWANTFTPQLSLSKARQWQPRRHRAGWVIYGDSDPASFYAVRRVSGHLPPVACDVTCLPINHSGLRKKNRPGAKLVYFLFTERGYIWINDYINSRTCTWGTVQCTETAFIKSKWRYAKLVFPVLEFKELFGWKYVINFDCPEVLHFVMHKILTCFYIMIALIYNPLLDQITTSTFKEKKG